MKSHSQSDQFAGPRTATLSAIGSLFRKSNKKNAKKSRVTNVSTDSVQAIAIPGSETSSPAPESFSAASFASETTAQSGPGGEKYLIRAASIETSATSSFTTDVAPIRKTNSMPLSRVVSACSPKLGSLITTNEVDSDKTRKCLEAFSEALRRNRGSQQSSPVLQHSPLIYGDAAQVETRTRLVRSHSSFKGQLPNDRVHWQQEKEHYAHLPLPDAPGLLAKHSSVHRKKVTLSKRSKQIQSDTKDYLTSISSGVQITSGVPESEVAVAQVIDRILAASSTLKWLAGGHGFFHEPTLETLKQPGAMCLSVQHPIPNFYAEFPQALETVFTSPPSEATGPAKARYTKLPFQDNVFDVISAPGLSTTVLAKHWPQTLHEFKRVLKPGGKLEIVAFGSSWVNASTSEKLVTQQSRFRKCLVDAGYHEELTEALPEMIAACEFSVVDVGLVAIPVGWGVSADNVFSIEIGFADFV